MIIGGVENELTGDTAAPCVWRAGSTVPKNLPDQRVRARASAESGQEAKDGHDEKAHAGGSVGTPNPCGECIGHGLTLIAECEQTVKPS